MNKNVIVLFAIIAYDTQNLYILNTYTSFAND